MKTNICIEGDGVPAEVREEPSANIPSDKLESQRIITKDGELQCESIPDINIPVDALLRNNAHCTEHVTDIENLYTCIINDIQTVERTVFHLNQLLKSFTQSLVGSSMLRIIMLWLEMHSDYGIFIRDPPKANYTTV